MLHFLFTVNSLKDIRLGGSEIVCITKCMFSKIRLLKTPNISKNWKKPETTCKRLSNTVLQDAKDIREGYCALKLPAGPERQGFLRQTLHECDLRLAACACACDIVCFPFCEVLYRLLDQICPSFDINPWAVPLHNDALCCSTNASTLFPRDLESSALSSRYHCFNIRVHLTMPE